MGRISSSFININTKFFKKFADVLSVGAVIALAFNPLMPLVEFLPAQAVSSNISETLGTDDATSSGAIGVSSDSQLGSGSWQNDQSKNKLSFYLPLESLPAFTVEDIENISFATKKLPADTTGFDFYATIYTEADDEDDDSWYGRRITIDPYYSTEYNSGSATWNVWNTAESGNTSTVYDSNNSAYGWYDSGTNTTAKLADLQNGPVNWNDYLAAAPSSSINYADETVSLIAISTGSSWNSNFSGLVDNVNVVLKDGSTLNVDLEGPDTQKPNMESYQLSDYFVGASDANPTLTGTITDEDSVIDRVNYAIWELTDGGSKGVVIRNWTSLPAADGSYDETGEETDSLINGVKNFSTGQYILGVRGYDEAGNKASGGDLVFTVDQDAPMLSDYQLSKTVIGPFDSSTQLTGEISDEWSDIDRVMYAIWKLDESGNKIDVARNWTGVSAAVGDYDSQNETTDSAIDVSSLSEGEYTLGVRGWDVAQNKGSGGDLNFTVDHTAPGAPELVFPHDGAVLNSNDLYLDWEAPDNCPVLSPVCGDLNICEILPFLCEDGFLPSSSLSEIEELEESIDNTDIDRYEYRLYLENPEENRDADVRFAKDYPADITRHPAEGFASGTPEDTYWWRVRTCDGVGNCSNWTPAWMFTVDDSAPEADVTSHDDGNTVSGEITIEGSVTDTNLSHYWLVVEDGDGNYVTGPKVVDHAGPNATPSFVWDTSTVEDGEYTIKLEARDEADNKDPDSASPADDTGQSIDWVNVKVSNSEDDETENDTSDDNGDQSNNLNGQGGNDQNNEDENQDLAFNSQGNTAVPTVLSANTASNDDEDQNEDDEENGDVLQAQDNQDDENENTDENENEEDSNFWWWLLLIALLGGGIYAYARNRNS